MTIQVMIYVHYVCVLYKYLYFNLVVSLVVTVSWEALLKSSYIVKLYGYIVYILKIINFKRK